MKKLQDYHSVSLILVFLFQPLNLCDIEEVASVLVSKEDEISQKVDIELRDPEKEVSKKQVELGQIWIWRIVIAFVRQP